MNARVRAYQRRNKYLAELGFHSYRDYLKSPLWARIRRRIRATRKKCLVCGSKRRLEVHHKRYTRDNVTGKSIKWLCLVCRKCHKGISRLERKKNYTPAKATSIFLENHKYKTAHPS